MELKKHTHVSLEHQRGLFLKIGFLFALALTLLLFEWQTPIKSAAESTAMMGIDVEIEMIQQTRMEELKPPKPMIKNLEILKITEEPIIAEDEMYPEDYGTSFNEAVFSFETTEEKIPEPAFIHDYAQQMPHFPGGKSGLLKFISQHINYPAMARENNIQGKVFVKFVVNEKGFVEQAIIVRSVDRLLDNEALRVVSNLPRWRPGYNLGRPVKVWYTIPITFKLN